MKFTGSDQYVATPDLMLAVNAAICLQRPLLIKGEPGTGKTMLAEEVAAALGLPLLQWHIKSTTKAQQGLYEYDAVSRLRDSQLGDDRVKDIGNYIVKGVLWQAFEAEQQTVVLIDEVDKADIDFPNNLLDVLDRFEFDIEDLPRAEDEACAAARGFGRHVKGPEGGLRPIVLITSNREKQLPEPFLRRCLYVQLDFPADNPAMLADIVRKYLAARLDQIGDELITGAVERLCRIRERGRELGMQKLPATSELVDWVRVLHWQGRKAEAVSVDSLDTVDQAVLFKVRQDIERYRARTDDEARR